MKENGYLISIANYTDKKDIVGSVNYKTVLAILANHGSKALVKLLHSPDWPFTPDQ